MPSPARTRAGYLPSLDGWRAIAILAVMAVHETDIVVRGHNLEPWQRYGSLGVVLFFAISGVLICSRILEEEELTGRFHLKLFYIRRFFRIQPAAWVYLAAIALLMLAGVFAQSWKSWLSALFLYSNFTALPDAVSVRDAYFTGHFWTLAVEEHFYLLISLALFFIRKRRLLIFGVALLLIKSVQVVLQHHTPDPLLRRTYWQIHILLWPAVAAIALRKPEIRAWAVRWLQPGLIFVCTAIAGLLAMRLSATLLLNVLEYAFTFWVVATMLHPKSWSTRALEWTPLRFVGRISYSLYLWHVLFFSHIVQMPLHSRVLAFLSERPWKYVAAFAAATASFYLIEKPLVRLGHKLAPPATPGHRDLADLPALAPNKVDPAAVPAGVA